MYPRPKVERKNYLQKILSNDEVALIYNTLADSDISEAAKLKFLKPYTRSEEGLNILISALNFAMLQKILAPRVIANLKSHITIAKTRLSADETAFIYNTLANSDISEAARSKFLKPYTRSKEGLNILISVLNFALTQEDLYRAEKNKHVMMAMYLDYCPKLKTPDDYAAVQMAPRVIADLKAHIAIAKTRQMHPLWDQRKIISPDHANTPDTLNSEKRMTA